MSVLDKIRDAYIEAFCECLGDASVNVKPRYFKKQLKKLESDNFNEVKLAKGFSFTPRSSSELSSTSSSVNSSPSSRLRTLGRPDDWKLRKKKMSLSDLFKRTKALKELNGDSETANR